MTPVMFWLQWGRGSSAAEGHLGLRAQVAVDRLQWGRGSSAAEGLRLRDE